MGTILVTGGAGFIGSHTCEALLSRGDHVVSVDNLDPFYSKEQKLANLALLQRPGFTSIIADITDRAALERVFTQHSFDAVIHIAALAGVRTSVEEPLRYEKVNVQGTLHLLEACRKRGIKRFVFASSSSVYGEESVAPFKETERADRPASPYAATKRAGEHLCFTYSHLFGMHCTCLRFFSVYGPRGRPDMAVWKFTESILTKPPLVIHGDGSTKRDFTYVGDIVSGILAALDLSPRFEIINLGNGTPVSLKDLLAITEKVTGKKASVTHDAAKPEDVPVTHADLTKAKEVLRYTPRVGLEEGVRRFVEWYRTR